MMLDWTLTSATHATVAPGRSAVNCRSMTSIMNSSMMTIMKVYKSLSVNARQILVPGRYHFFHDSLLRCCHIFPKRLIRGCMYLCMKRILLA